MNRQIKNEKILSRMADPRYIILAPLYNMLSTSTVFPPNIVIKNYKYSWPAVQNYYQFIQNRDTMPMHWFVEFLDKDYVFHVGMPLSFNSWYLAELIKMKVIHHQYKNAFVICIQDDWRLEVPDRRMIEGICHFLISPLLREYKINRNNVVPLSDILVENALDIARFQDNILNRFDLSKAKYYDHIITQTTLKRFLK